MITAIILIRVETGLVWRACEAIKRIDGVKSCHAVTGPYDIIAYAELPSSEDLRRMIKSMHAVDGVNRTETCVAI